MEEATTIQTAAGCQASKGVRTILLLCGVLSSLLYVGADLLATMRYPGYSYTDQMFSELLALGAPTRPFMIAPMTVYNALVIAFAVGV